MKVLLLVFALAIPAGCVKIPVKTIRDYHNSIGKGYVRYLNADERFTADEKRIRLQTFNSMDRLLKEAEK